MYGIQKLRPRLLFVIITFLSSFCGLISVQTLAAVHHQNDDHGYRHHQHLLHDIENLADDCAWLKDRQGNSSRLCYNSSTGRSSAAPAMVVWTVFAGRRQALSLQLQYMISALEKQLVDEVHLWDYTCKKAGGARYYNEKEGLYNKRYIRLKLFERNDRFFYAKPAGFNCSWNDYFQFYSRFLKPDDIIMKFDDDILFVDTTRLGGYLRTIRKNPQVFLWSANVINNGKAGVLQTNDGMIREANVSISKELRPRIRGPGAAMGHLYRNGTHGLAIHREFLSDPQRFFKPLPNKELRFLRTRISINCIALLGRHFPRAAHYVNLNGGDDEHALTQYASVEQNETLVVYMPFLVSHASFSTQSTRKPDGLCCANIHEYVLEMYRNATIRNNVEWDSLVEENGLKLPETKNEEYFATGGV
jgi:hypothetical protein